MLTVPSASAIHDLKTLVLSFHPLVLVESVEEERVRDLTLSVAKQLGLELFEWSITQGLVREGQTGSPIATTAPASSVLAHIRSLRVQAIFLLKDFGPHLDDPKVVRLLREVCQELREARSTVVIIGASIDVPTELAHQAIHFNLMLPDERELEGAIRPVISSLTGAGRARNELKSGDFPKLVAALRGLTLHQARQTVARVIVDDQKLGAEDIPQLLDRKASLLREGGLLEYYPAATNQFELGGFGRLKAWLDRVAVGFTEKARKMNLPAPKGMVLVGVQGCGKSLAAKVVARQWNMPLLRLDAGSLYDKFVGETEKNFRRSVRVAESMAPAVLWIDEIEKAFAGGRTADADGGLSRRVLGMFLTWMQEKSAGVFVVATANDLDALPPEMLRKGRFDEVFFVDLPTEAERLEIFGIHLRLRHQDPEGVDRQVLVAETRGFSGSEIEQVVVAGLYRTLHRGESRITTEILLEEIRGTVPLSVSRAEDINRLRATAKNRFVPVS